jgi:hypothetical protein
MDLSSSPKLQEYQNGIPDKPKDPAARRKMFRIVLAILFVLVILGAGIKFFTSPTAMLLSSKGEVIGQVVDEQGRPLAAEVYVFGVDQPIQANENGEFTLTGPAGLRSLIVAYHGTAQEYTVEILAGETTDIGKIAFRVATPEANP